MSVTLECSLGEGELSGLEVGGLLGNSEGGGSLLVLGETSAGGLSALGAEVHGGVSLLLEGLSGDSSSLLVDDGEVAGDGLSDNLK